MSENFPGGTFAYQKITPSEDAAVRRAAINDGVLAGCALSYSGVTLTMSSGSLFACGRVVRHPLEQHWPVVGATSGFARLVLTVDLSRTATQDEFDQVIDTIEYADTVDGFNPLVQEDINAGGTRYQMAAAVVSLGAGGITGIVQAAAILNGLQSYAPAGFGLGQESPLVITSLAALDSLTKCGFYRLDIQSGTASISAVNVSRATVFVEGYNGVNVMQTLSVLGSTTRLYRYRSGGIWSEWCFENPPMVAPWEYRTTEYWGGSPVYTKRFSHPANAFTTEDLSLPHYIENMDVCLSADVIWKRTDRSPDGWRFLPAADYGDSTLNAQVRYVSEENIYFQLGWNIWDALHRSTEPVYITLRYTKK